MEGGQKDKIEVALIDRDERRGPRAGERHGHRRNPERARAAANVEPIRFPLMTSLRGSSNSSAYGGHRVTGSPRGRLFPRSQNMTPPVTTLPFHPAIRAACETTTPIPRSNDPYYYLLLFYARRWFSERCSQDSSLRPLRPAGCVSSPQSGRSWTARQNRGKLQ
jgi:hypothetical protein